MKIDGQTPAAPDESSSGMADAGRMEAGGFLDALLASLQTSEEDRTDTDVQDAPGPTLAEAREGDPSSESWSSPAHLLALALGTDAGAPTMAEARSDGTESEEAAPGEEASAPQPHPRPVSALALEGSASETTARDVLSRIPTQTGPPDAPSRAQDDAGAAESGPVDRASPDEAGALLSPPHTPSRRSSEGASAAALAAPPSRVSEGSVKALDGNAIATRSRAQREPGRVAPERGPTDSGDGPRVRGDADVEEAPTTRDARRASDGSELARVVASSSASAPPELSGSMAKQGTSVTPVFPGVVMDPAVDQAKAGAEASLEPRPVQALPQHIQVMASEGGGTARVRLHPPELGDVQIRVVVRGSSVDVVIQADEGTAQHAVTAQRDQLAEALGTRDLRMEGFDVRNHDRGEARRDPWDQASAGQQGFDDGARPDQRMPWSPGSSLRWAEPNGASPSPGRPGAMVSSGSVDLRI